MYCFLIHFVAQKQFGLSVLKDLTIAHVDFTAGQNFPQ